MSFPRGMRELLEALEAKVASGAWIRQEAPVAALTAQGSGFELCLNGERAPADAVILAVPAYHAADLLASVLPAIEAPLRGIPYASSAIVVSGHRLADITHPLDAFGLVVPAVEGRQILAVSFASRKLPGRAPEGRVLLRTFVGGATQSELFAESDSAILAIVRRELAAIFGVSGAPDFAQVFRHEKAMPQYEIGHLDRIAAIEGALAGAPRVALAGNAYRGVGVPDTIASAEAAAERIVASLSK